MMKLKRPFFLPMLSWLALGLLLSAGAPAQTADPFQRVLTFRNSLPGTIYPVIQSPQDKNCGIGGLLRIVINNGAEGTGVGPGETVKVMLPKTQPCAIGAFYDASRIYIFVTSFAPYEAALNKDQQTVRYKAWDYQKDPICPGCWVGTATADYGHDAPGQLLEYTLISQNPATGDKFPDPNDTHGTPVIDFDVSYVDHAYLPVAMAIGDGGATQFMGSTLTRTPFVGRLTQFVNGARWSVFGAYSPAQWATPAECPPGASVPTNINKTRFSCLTGRTDRVPSASILVATAQDGGTSQYYRAAWDGVTPRACGAQANLQCSYPTPAGAGLPPGNICCPDTSGGSLACCKVQNFMIADTTLSWTPPASSVFSNKALESMVDRFTHWQGKSNPCAGTNAPGKTQAPVLDKAGFCTAYKRTIDYVWSVFAPQCSSKRPDALDRCTTSAIIGYDLKNSTFDPDQCTGVCPGPKCPRSCVNETLKNESVQALQRGLPWTPSGDPASCRLCPSGDEAKCPSSCILPVTVSPDATLYHRDKFLHFWAGSKSLYNVNPYARFVHNGDTGLAAPGAYSFSIDDFYGNFGGRGSELIIEAGGTSAMPNKEPFDPFKQYVAGLGTGWDHARVCGRLYKLPPSAPPTVGLSAPISFWNNGVPLPECEVRMFPTADESIYIVFKLKEVKYSVVDRYTGKTHEVKGLSGVFANRFPGDSPPDDPYCSKNSTAKELVDTGKCKANLSAGTLNLDYVGVSNDKRRCKSNDAKCGKPLVNLNAPARN